MSAQAAGRPSGVAAAMDSRVTRPTRTKSLLIRVGPSPYPTGELGFRSSSATVGEVVVIPQKELRNNVGDVLRRAEAGEEFTITVAGRPVAQLGPVRRRQWVSGPELTKIWQTPAPRTLDEDLERFPGELADPFT